MLRVGLTGGIASGKTTVAKLFESLGVSVIYADEISRDVVKPGSQGLHEVQQKFGSNILNASGQLDRAALRKLIFSDASKREALEKILHPLIRAQSEALAEEAKRRGETYVIFEIPLLLETGRHKEMDKVLVVDVPEETQLNRLMKRDHCSEAQAKQILSAQSNRPARLAIADNIIFNEGNLDKLTQQVEHLHQQYTDESGQHSVSHPNCVT